MGRGNGLKNCKCSKSLTVDIMSLSKELRPASGDMSSAFHD